MKELFNVYSNKWRLIGYFSTIAFFALFGGSLASLNILGLAIALIVAIYIISLVKKKGELKNFAYGAGASVVSLFIMLIALLFLFSALRV